MWIYSIFSILNEMGTTKNQVTMFKKLRLLWNMDAVLMENMESLLLPWPCDLE